MPLGIHKHFARHVFESTSISRKGENKAVFEDRAFIARLRKISKRSGVVQVSQKKLGFSFSLRGKMFISVSFARSHGKEHK